MSLAVCGMANVGAFKNNICPPHFLCPFCQPRLHHQVKYFTPLYTPNFRSAGLFLRAFGNPLLLRWSPPSTGSLAGQANLSQQIFWNSWDFFLQAKTLLACWSSNLELYYRHIKQQIVEMFFPNSLTSLWRVHYSRQDCLMLKSHSICGRVPELKCVVFLSTSLAVSKAQQIRLYWGSCFRYVPN